MLPAEVVLFTAGLEDYAKPILDELDRRYGAPLVHRLYRPATTTCSAYPCLKVRGATPAACMPSSACAGCRAAPLPPSPEAVLQSMQAEAPAPPPT